MDLLDIQHDEPIPGLNGMSRAVTEMCKAKRCKLAVATKILHKKRPSLSSCFDSFAGELTDLRAWTRENGTPMTGARILNALIWAVRVTPPSHQFTLRTITGTTQ
jgi:hypothetical protein